MNFESNTSALPTLRMATITPVSGNAHAAPASPSITPIPGNNQQLQQPPSSGSMLSATSKNTLWQGDLDPWMDENYIKQIWSSLGETVAVKMIRDKLTGMNAGYCFVEFASFQTAINALQNVNGVPIPNTNKLFKLNWASGGGIHDKSGREQGPEFSIFVGDLGPEVDDDLLFNTFHSHFTSCKTAKVVTDSVTNLSRGYGFVRFSDEAEQQRAMAEMQGHFCGSRPMRISVATPKNRFGNYAYWNAVLNSNWSSVGNADPSNTTVFVGGLTNNFVSEEELASYFAPFGPITYVKIPTGKGCGFVSFVHRQSAENAIVQLNGTIISGNRVRLSWGRNSNSPAVSPPPSQVGANWKQSQPLVSSGGQSMMIQGHSSANNHHHHHQHHNHNHHHNGNGSFSSPEKILLTQPSYATDKQFALKSTINGNGGSSVSNTGFGGARGLFGGSDLTESCSNNNNNGNNNNCSNSNITGNDSEGWKNVNLPFEPISRPSSAFTITSPFSQISFPHHQLRSAAGLPSPASSNVIRFASAPNSPETSSRTTPTPTPSGHYSSVGTSSFFE